ncbi:MAG: hypothetical protein QOK48_1720 [Blastocatellia bacterium]|jgi:hypothetical protein|nr:hypothetical protein [Blastocatellia bacterium]
MAADLTEQEFSQHVGTPFQLNLNEPTIELRLSSVKGYPAGSNEHEGMERFSAFFDGPTTPQLLQAVYHLTHEKMGEFDLFLVPIAKTAEGFRYEAVFNYFKK